MNFKATNLKSWRATKILATLGSASESEEQITKLVQSGVNIVRMNFSHGTHEEHLMRITRVRTVEKKLSKPIYLVILFLIDNVCEFKQIILRVLFIYISFIIQIKI